MLSVCATKAETSRSANTAEALCRLTSKASRPGRRGRRFAALSSQPDGLPAVPTGAQPYVETFRADLNPGALRVPEQSPRPLIIAIGLADGRQRGCSRRIDSPALADPAPDA